MKKIFYTLLVSFFIFNCNTTKSTSTIKKNERVANLKQNDTIKITNNEIEYEIIIIEPGFNAWLASTARSRGFYSQQFMEARNSINVMQWNLRVNDPLNYNQNLYELQIDYQRGIDYGYEVNYLLYNYFIYFQLTYNQRLGTFNPRI